MFEKITLLRINSKLANSKDILNFFIAHSSQVNSLSTSLYLSQVNSVIHLAVNDLPPPTGMELFDHPVEMWMSKICINMLFQLHSTSATQRNY